MRQVQLNVTKSLVLTFNSEAVIIIPKRIIIPWTYGFLGKTF